MIYLKVISMRKWKNFKYFIEKCLFLSVFGIWWNESFLFLKISQKIEIKNKEGWNKRDLICLQQIWFQFDFCSRKDFSFSFSSLSCHLLFKMTDFVKGISIHFDWNTENALIKWFEFILKLKLFLIRVSIKQKKFCQTETINN